MKKIKNKIFLIILITISIMIINTNVIAALEIKPIASTDGWYGLNASDCYQICQDLRKNDSTLGNNDLDPHLSLNKDWGAAAYLSISSYGSARSKLGGTQIKVGTAYLISTTGNKTGIFQLGGSSLFYNYTSALMEGCSNSSSIDAIYQNKDSKYVEKISPDYTIENTKGMALQETSGWWESKARNVSENFPLVIRNEGPLGYSGSNGEKASNYTVFRPVIWNK